MEPLLNRGEILILCAHLESADQFVRKLAEVHGAVHGIRRLTLDTLAYQLALPVLGDKGISPQSRLAEEAIAARVVQQLLDAGQLGPYESVAHWPGFARALTATFRELRLHEIAPKTLTAKATPLMVALGQLLDRFEATSLDAGVADRAQVFEAASRVVEYRETPPVGIPTLLLDVGLTTPREQKLVAALARKSPRVLATVPAGDEQTLAALERILGCSPQVTLPDPAQSRPIQQLQRFLFSESTPPTPISSSSHTEVGILSAPGEAQEAVELAREIHQEAGRGVPFDSIAILLRSPEVYTPLLEDALARAGVPAYFANGIPRPDPAGRAFLSLMDCAAEQLSASRFAEYLSLGQLPGLEDGTPPSRTKEDLWVAPRHDFAPSPTVATGGPEQLDLFASPTKVREPELEPAIEGTLRAPRRWEKLLVDAAVIGGRDRWERRLAGLENEFRARLQEIEDPEGSEAAAIVRQLEDLRHLRRFALPLIGILSELPARAEWRVWLDALKLLASSALASPDNVLKLLGELAPMDSVGPVEIFEVRRVLAERLTLMSQEPPPYRYGRVWIAPIEAARGMSFEVVLVPGLAERMFPRKIVEDPLLLDSWRKEISPSLPQQEDRIGEERLALRLAAGAAHRRIVFSYPSVDLQKGRSKVPSFYLLEVVRASQGELPDFEALEKQAAASSGARLGWPAPREAMGSIDETELDLAFLAEALRVDTSELEARGTGRYLMTVNPSLARSLRMRFLRSRPGKFYPPDGFLDPSSDTVETLANARLTARAYSVTALEKYAWCPYRFFLHAIIRLRPRDTIGYVTHMDALTRGRIMHEAQFEVSKKLEDEGLLPIGPQNLTAALAVCEATFAKVTARFAEELAPAIDRIWQDETDRIRTDLRGWIRRESESSESWIPIHREYTFGMRPRGPADPESVLHEAVLSNGLRLRGAIDLVEKGEDGRARITDYKSGRAWVPPQAVVNGGETLQPVLYALAFESLTGREVAESRLYYCTDIGGYEQRRIVPDEETLSVVEEFQRRLDTVIAEGFFPAAPKPTFGCRFCDYRSVCGPRAEVNATRKQKDSRLSPLNWLRNLT